MRLGTDECGDQRGHARRSGRRGARRPPTDGFDTFWVSQIFGHDALTALAVVGREVPRHRARHRRRADVPAAPDDARPAGADRAGGHAAGGCAWASACPTRSSSRACGACRSASRSATCASTSSVLDAAAARASRWPSTARTSGCTGRSTCPAARRPSVARRRARCADAARHRRAGRRHDHVVRRPEGARRADRSRRSARRRRTPVVRRHGSIARCRCCVTDDVDGARKRAAQAVRHLRPAAELQDDDGPRGRRRAGRHRHRRHARPRCATRSGRWPTSASPTSAPACSPANPDEAAATLAAVQAGRQRDGRDLRARRSTIVDGVATVTIDNGADQPVRSRAVPGDGRRCPTSWPPTTTCASSCCARPTPSSSSPTSTSA